jgi:ATP-dependent RNA helicase DDX18/HAS1
MTHVQDKTIPLIARGFDVLVRSRTGTGKTLAYLIPIIERLIYKKISPNSNKISVIILVPNRELALQTAATANQLLSYHHNPNPKGPRSGGSKGDGTIMGLHGADEGRAEGGANHAYEVQTLIGGSNAREEQEPIMNSKCHILVSTPGRLVYHMKHTPGFMERTVRMDTICLDEVDRLITLGYAYIYVDMRIPTYLSTYLPTYVHTYVRMYIHTCINLHTIAQISKGHHSAAEKLADAATDSVVLSHCQHASESGRASCPA